MGKAIELFRSMRGAGRTSLGFSLFLAWIYCVYYSAIVCSNDSVSVLGKSPSVISMLVAGVVGLLLCVFLSGRLSRKPMALPGWAAWASAVCCAAGTLLLLDQNTGPQVPILLALAIAMTAFGFAGFVLLWGSAISTLGNSLVETVPPLSFLVAQAFFLILNVSDHRISSLVSVLLPLLSLFVWTTRTLPAKARGNGAVLGLATKRRCLIALAVLLLFRFWCGVVLSITESVVSYGMPLYFGYLVLSAFVFSVFIFSSIYCARSLSVSTAITWVFPLVLLAFAFLVWRGWEAAYAVHVANRACSLCLQAFFYILFAKYSAGSSSNGLFGFSCFLTGITLGYAGGQVVGQWLGAVFPAEAVTGLLAFGIAAMSLVLNLLGSKETQMKLSGEQQEADTDLPASPLLQSGPLGHLLVDRSHEMARRYQLSKREEEILSLLLAGRNRPYIRDQLFISINTVNTHIKHIYKKTGAHSQQDLIDLAHGKSG